MNLSGDSNTDLNDLLYVIEMRFGHIESDILNKILVLREPSIINRLILVAANCNSIKTLEEEIDKGDSFKITGKRYDPLSGE
ncbi:MAG: hypothetical protein QXN26_03220 [Thermoplasmataceae archaeon]